MRYIAPALAVSLLAVTASAQATHFVGPAGFAQINDALAVAAPGDIVVVSPGSYFAFTVTTDVTIRAATPGTVMISSFSMPWPPLGNIVSLAAGATARLVDLNVQVLTLDGGTTTLDGCTLTPYGLVDTTALTVAGGSTVHLHGCSVIGGNGPVGLRAGLTATNATITAVDSSFTGGNISSPYKGPPPGPAILLQGCTFHGSRVSALGGAGSAPGFYTAEVALRSSGGVVWLSDSTLTGGMHTNGTRSCPLNLSVGRLDRCTLDPVCPVSVPTTGPLLGVHRVAPPQSPGSLGLEFATDANGFVAVYFSTSLGSLTSPLLEQPIALDPANMLPVVLLLADAFGQTSVTWNVPAGIGNQTWWFQGVSGPTFPLQLSPVVGGVLR